MCAFAEGDTGASRFDSVRAFTQRHCMRKLLLVGLVWMGCGGAPLAAPGPRPHPTSTMARWPTEIEGIEDAQRLFAGQHPCVLRGTGEVVCIDRGTDYAILDNELEFAQAALPQAERTEVQAEMDRMRGHYPEPTQHFSLVPWTHAPTPFEAPRLTTPFTAARVGVAEGCAVIHEGRDVACWNGWTAIDAPAITAMPEGEVAVEVSFTVERNRLSICWSWAESIPHTCARMASGRVACWGWNFVGQLGNGTRVDSATPVFVHGISDAQALATGTHQNCVIHTDRTVSCWGYGSDGQLGDGANHTREEPVRVEALHDIVSLALGGYHSCALDGQGRAFCWGPMNRFGMHETRNLEAVFLGAPERLAEIVAGDTYTCARSETGHVFCGGWY